MGGGGDGEDLGGGDAAGGGGDEDGGGDVEVSLEDGGGGGDVAPSSEGDDVLESSSGDGAVSLAIFLILYSNEIPAKILRSNYCRKLHPALRKIQDPEENHKMGFWYDFPLQNRNCKFRN